VARTEPWPPRPLEAWAATLRRSPLAVRLVLLSVLVTALVVGAVFVALDLQLRASTRRRFADELLLSQRSVVRVQRRALQDLLRTLSLVTQSPTLHAAMETYRVEAATGHGTQPELLATVQRETDRILGELGKDLLVVTNDSGRVLAAAGRDPGRPAAGTELGALLTIRRALDPAAVIDSGNYGVLEFGGRYYQAASVPIVLAGFTIGTVTLGEQLDRTFVPRLREAFSGEIVVAGGGRVVSSTLPSAAPQDLASALPAAGNSANGTPRTVRIGREQFVAALLPLGSDQRAQPVTLYLLRSLTRAVAPLDRTMLLDLALYGSLGVLLVGLGAGLVARSALGPLRHFVGFMGRVAQSGEYGARFDAGRSSDEIRTLNETYDRLIASLQRHQAELERTNETLRAQIAERERAEQALQESEEQLRQSQKLEALGTLAGGVAHDFNNLLTVIISYAELLLGQAGPGSRMRSDLEQVRDAGQQAARLTTQLLAFSRKQVLQPRVIDLNHIVESMEKMLRRLLGEDIDLRTGAAEALPRIQADPGQVEQVILNLAVNARDAMPRGGTLVIETAAMSLAQEWISRHGTIPAGDWVILSVSDTGTGMDDATRARIFEPFFTTKEPGKGTGLGLSTVYGIVAQSGGHLWVYSELGRGTTFKIYFPQVHEAAEAEPEIRAPVRGGTETILLVEDEGRVRLLAEQILRGMGYHVLCAADGAAALEVAAQHRALIHLLVTDVVMPHRQPIRYLLQKPFTPDALQRRVREVLDAGVAAEQ